MAEEYKKFDHDDGYRYAKLAMTWNGWGSPIGLGLFFVFIGATIYLLHLARLF